MNPKSVRDLLIHLGLTAGLGASVAGCNRAGNPLVPFYDAAAGGGGESPGTAGAGGEGDTPWIGVGNAGGPGIAGAGGAAGAGGEGGTPWIGIGNGGMTGLAGAGGQGGLPDQMTGTAGIGNAIIPPTPDGSADGPDGGPVDAAAGDGLDSVDTAAEQTDAESEGN